jgi:hypothetical protein
MAAVHKALCAQIPINSGQPKGELDLFYKYFHATVTILWHHLNSETWFFRKCKNNLLWDNSQGMVYVKPFQKSSICSRSMVGFHLEQFGAQTSPNSHVQNIRAPLYMSCYRAWDGRGGTCIEPKVFCQIRNHLCGPFGRTDDPRDGLAGV